MAMTLKLRKNQTARFRDIPHEVIRIQTRYLNVHPSVIFGFRDIEGG